MCCNNNYKLSVLPKINYSYIKQTMKWYILTKIVIMIQFNIYHTQTSRKNKPVTFTTY